MRLLVLLLISVSSIGIFAITNNTPSPSDTIITNIKDSLMSRQLNEVVINADRQFISDDKVVFMPTKNEKKLAANGILLLQNMSIPSIFVSPIDNTIQTSAGDQVATFIDYMPATQSDLANIRTMDVVRVEVFEYPKDPRFGGVRHVVNFILKKYEYGGYTKVTGQQRIVDNSGDYNIASKFVYKKMTYDLAGGYSYSRNNHNGANTTTDYEFRDININRSEMATKSRYKQDIAFLSFRTIYQSNKIVILNTLGVKSIKQPDCFINTNTSFTPEIYKSDISQTKSDNSSLMPSWNGNYQFYLPNNFTFVINPSASFGKFSQKYNFITTEASIINDVKETAWDFSSNASLQKQIKSHSLSLSLLGGGQGNNMDYTGTTPAIVNTQYYYGGGQISANLRFGKVWLQGNIGLYFNHTSINDEALNELHPKYFIAAGYSFNNKNSIALASEMSYWAIPLSLQGSNMQIQNQIDAIQGNPDLNAYRYNAVKLQYLWLPTNILSLSAYGGFRRMTDPVSYIYEPLESSTTPIMVRNLINCGFLNNWNYGGAINLKFINNTLAIRAGISGEYVNLKGTQPYRGNLISFDLSAMYSIKNYWSQFIYNSKNKNISPTSQIEIPQYYSFGLGWGNGNLNIAIKANNFFNSKWDANKKTINTYNYKHISQSFSSKFHRSFELFVSYSFSYGKKVDYSNSPNADATINSAILK